jgi:hypothetical protein
MFTLIRQVQLATDHARDGVARLGGQDSPKYDNTETTLEELQERIARSIQYLQTLSISALDGAETREISRPLLNNRVLEASGLEYFTGWILPQFYFHLVTAYDILRHSGVGIGKWDFLGELSQSVRQR